MASSAVRSFVDVAPAIQAAHAGEVAALRDQAAALKALAARLEAELVAATEATEAARAEAREARQALDALRGAEAAWWQQRRWRRLLAAWRGG